jgi:hypothetical protein
MKEEKEKKAELLLNQKSPFSSFKKNITNKEIIEDEDEEELDCLICCDKIKVFSLLECDHTEICYKCSLINRILLNEKKCSVCKTESKNIILTKNPKAFKDFVLEELYFDKKWEIYLENQNLKDYILNLRVFQCKECSEYKDFYSLKELEKHLQKNHNKQYCKLCLENRKVFLIDQITYTAKELQYHIKYGEKYEHGIINGHPECKFCKERLYSVDELFKHMQLNHFQCDICRENKILYEYYRDYNHLEEHFKSKLYYL